MIQVSSVARYSIVGTHPLYTPWLGNLTELGISVV
jgi:hypothetical protein